MMASEDPRFWLESRDSGGIMAENKEMGDGKGKSTVQAWLPWLGGSGGLCGAQ